MARDIMKEARMTAELLQRPTEGFQKMGMLELTSSERSRFRKNQGPYLKAFRAHARTLQPRAHLEESALAIEGRYLMFIPAEQTA